DAVGQPAVAHVRARADDAFAADGGGPGDDGLRVDHAVGADRHRVVDVRAGGIVHGDALDHQPIEDPPPLDGGEGGELLAVVDAHRLDRVGDGDGLHLGPGARQHADDVGEIELALVVVRLDLGQR